MEIEKVLNEIISEIISEKSEASSITGLAINSIDYISIIVRIEEEFDIEVPDEYLLFDNKLDIPLLISMVEQCTGEINNK